MEKIKTYFNKFCDFVHKYPDVYSVLSLLVVLVALVISGNFLYGFKNGWDIYIVFLLTGFSGFYLWIRWAKERRFSVTSLASYFFFVSFYFLTFGDIEKNYVLILALPGMFFYFLAWLLVDVCKDMIVYVFSPYYCSLESKCSERFMENIIIGVMVAVILIFTGISWYRNKSLRQAILNHSFILSYFICFAILSVIQLFSYFFN